MSGRAIEILLTKKSHCDILFRCGCRGENHHCLRGRGEKADALFYSP
jgi:hypothetical protein